jgi:hypothetical protein
MKIVLAFFGILTLAAGTLLGMALTSYVGEMRFHEWLQHPHNLWTQPFHEWKPEPPPPMGPTDPLQRRWRDLALLVAKLDELSAQPVALNLTDKQRGELQERLTQVEDIDQMNDEAVQKHLDALLKVLEPNKGALEAVGFHWPGAADVPTQQTHSPHVKSLRESLAKNKSA